MKAYCAYVMGIWNLGLLENCEIQNGYSLNIWTYGKKRLKLNAKIKDANKYCLKKKFF